MTTIRNGTGITAVQRTQDARVAGEPAGPGFDRPYENPLLPQISTLTLAAVADVSDEIVADQVWTITLTDPDGVAYRTLYTVTAADNTAGTDGAGLAHMATQLAAALEANGELVNIVSASAAAAVITITWLHPNRGTWTVAAVCAPAAAEAVLLATAATSQTAGGSTLPMARVVAMRAPAIGGLRRAGLPSALTDILGGVALRDITQVRLYDTTLAAVDTYPAGSMVGVREEGDVHMVNTSATAAAIGDPVYVVIATTGGDLLGEVRPDAAGTADVWTLTPTAANAAVFGVQVYFPEWNGQPPQTFVFGNFTSDADGNATEISTGITDQMDADANFTALVVATGTATIILTGQDLGRPFVVTDVAEAGDFTSITHTTTAAAYTMLAPRWRWVRPAAPGAVGTIRLAR
jgi:hypothetical protein